MRKGKTEKKIKNRIRKPVESSDIKRKSTASLGTVKNKPQVISANKKKSQPKSRLKAQIKDLLFKMRKELIEDVSQSIKIESDHLRFDVGDFYDHATSDRARELSLMLTDRERQKLIQIDEALKKIEEGSYGICESCGDEIDEERLIAMPFAKLCLSCKIDLERQGNL